MVAREPQSQYQVSMRANNGDTVTYHYTKCFSSNVVERYESTSSLDLACRLSHAPLRVVNIPIVPMACSKGSYDSFSRRGRLTDPVTTDLPQALSLAHHSGRPTYVKGSFSRLCCKRSVQSLIHTHRTFLREDRVRTYG